LLEGAQGVLVYFREIRIVGVSDRVGRRNFRDAIRLRLF
jgi:hypothetical protein